MLKIRKKLFLFVSIAMVVLGLASCDTTAENAVKIRFDEDAYTIKLGQAIEIDPVIKKGEAVGNVEILCSSSDINVVTFNNGILTAVGLGETEIKIVWNEKAVVYDKAVVRVLRNFLPGFEFEDESKAILKGETVKIGYNFIGQVGEKVTVNWESENEDVLTVDAEGNVTGVGIGRAYVVANVTDGDDTDSYKLVVDVAESDFAISYDLDGGVNAEGNPTGYNTLKLPLALLAPTKDGYKFEGWKWNEEIVTEIPAGTKEDVALVATWSLVEYTITYDLAEGTNAEANPDKFDVTKLPLALAEPTKEDYKFLGWYIGETKVEAIPANTFENVTLVAKWEYLIYDISYDLAEGAFPFVEYADKAAMVADFIADMNKLNPDYNTTNAAEYLSKNGLRTNFWKNAEMYAKWNWVLAYFCDLAVKQGFGEANIKYYTDMYNEGKEIGSISGYVTQSVVTFLLGISADTWNAEYKETYGGLSSKWTTINFTDEPAEAFQAYIESAPKTYRFGTVVELPTPVKANYDFVGWKLGEETVTAIPETASGDLALVAVWKATPYQITFELAEGQFNFIEYADKAAMVADFIADMNKLNPDYNTTNAAEYLSKNGLRTNFWKNAEMYAKWNWVLAYFCDLAAKQGFGATNTKYYTDMYNEGKEIGSISGYVTQSVVTFLLGISADTWNAEYKETYGSLSSKWTTINFTDEPAEAFQAYVPAAPKSFTVESKTISLPTPTREGYKFLGWFTTAEFTGEAVTEIAAGSFGTKVFYAKWELEGPKEYALTLNLNEGVLENAPTQYTVLDGLTLPVPTREGYTFEGWFDNAELAGEAVTAIAAGTMGEKAFYAKWAEIATKYDLVLNLNEGTLENAPTEYVIADGLTLPTPTREGFSFEGWFDNAELTGEAVTAIAPGTTGDKAFFAKWVEVEKYPYEYDGEMSEALINSLLEENQTVVWAQWATASNVTDSSYATQTAKYMKIGGMIIIVDNKVYLLGAGSLIKLNSTALGSTAPTLDQLRPYGSNDANSNGIYWNDTVVSNWGSRGYAALYYNSGSEDLQITLANTYGRNIAGYGYEKFVFSPTEVEGEYTNKMYAHAADLVVTLKPGEFLYCPQTCERFGTGLVTSTYTDGPNGAGVLVDGTTKVTITSIDKILDGKLPPEPTEYPLTLNLNEGTLADAPTKYVVADGLTLPTPSKDNYTFLGWFDNAELAGEAVTAIPADSKGEKTFWAKWQIVAETEYDITYVLNGGAWPKYDVQSYADFTEAILADFDDYFYELDLAKDPEAERKAPMTRTPDGEAHVIDFMGISYAYRDNIEAFFTTHEVYSAKWGWVLDYIIATGTTINDDYKTTRIRGNVHGLIYNTQWTKWPAAYDYSGVSYEEIADKIVAKISVPGASKYEVAKGLTLDKVSKEGFEFKGWYDNAEFTGEPITVIAAGTLGDLELYAKFEEPIKYNTLNVGEGQTYATVDDALVAAVDGDHIVVAAGTYGGALINKSVVILGPNANVNPNIDVRVPEAIFTDDLQVLTNNVTINGVQLSQAGQVIVPSDQPIKGLTVDCILLKDWTDAGLSTNAPIQLQPKTAEAIYTDIALTNSRFEACASRMMIIFGGQIVNLTVKNNEFYGSTSSGQYNDGLKINGSVSGVYTTTFDVKGTVKIIGNHFEDYMQYPVWLSKYGVGTYEIYNNSWKDCCLYKDYNEGAVTMNTFVAPEEGKVDIKIMYNTAVNSQIFARIHNAGATADNWAALISYNKIYQNIHAQYITNRGSNELDLIDARDNYYDVTPSDSFFDGVSMWSPYYGNEADVPAYVEKEEPDPQPDNDYKITFKLNGGVLTEVPRTYPANMTEPLVLPIPTRSATEVAVFTFVGWYDNAELAGEAVTEIAVGSSEDKIYYAKWSEALPEGLYTIGYETNGGTWSYASKSALLNDFLTDFYNFLLDKGAFTKTEMSLEQFMHAEGQTSGYQGKWGSYLGESANSYIGLEVLGDYMGKGSIDEGTEEEWFIYCSKYADKWLNFYNYVESMIKSVNSGQSFWGDMAVGLFRLWQFATGINKVGSGPASWMAGQAKYFSDNSVPDDSPTKAYYRAEDDTFTLPIPTKVGAAFLGWYDNSLFIGGPYTKLVTGSEGNIVFYAKWDEVIVADKVVGSGEAYATLAEALDAAVEGDIIEVKAGEYTGAATVKVNNITIRGAQAGMNPNKNTVLPSKESLYTDGVITVNAGVKGLTIDGMGFTNLGRFEFSTDAGIEDFTFKNNHIYDLKTDNANAFIEAKVLSDTSKNVNIAILDNLFAQVTTERAIRFFRGGNIENLYVTGNKFLNGRKDPTYTDTFRLGGTNDSASSGSGISGVILVKNNEFRNTGQRAFWLRNYSASKVEIVNNIFDNCGDQTYGGCLDAQGWTGGTNSLSVNISYNTFDVKEGNFAIRINTLNATLVGGYVQIHYNNFINGSAVYQHIGPKSLITTFIDAANNYFGGEAAPANTVYGSINADQYYKTLAELPTLTEGGEILPAAVELTNAELNVKRYTSLQLTWNVIPASASDKRVVFESSDPAIFTVDANGLVSAKGLGSAVITVKSAINDAIVDTITLSSYAPDYITGSYETTSYVVKGENIQLNAQLVGASTGEVVWSSADETIATVNSGVVTGVKAGFVKIVAKDSTNAETVLEFGVTVLDEAVAEGVMTFLANAHENETYVYADLPIGAGIPVYYSTVVGSVSKVIFNHAYAQKEITNTSTKNHGGTKTSTEFITVHYTGNMNAGADAAANANYFAGSDSVSINYTTGNDGVYHILDDSLVAYHAGDGTSATFEWLPTGVMVLDSDPVTPVVSINANAKFTINGRDTTISTPNNLVDPAYLTCLGPGVKVVEGQYYMGTTYFNTDYNKIASHGGNNNSIGIESCVNKGSDLWLTWQYTAQLVAKLMKDNSLDITRVKGHNFFSGKDCPQPMLESDCEIWYEFIAMVEAEYELLTKYSDYTITFESLTPELIDNNGTVIAQPAFTTVASYKLTVTKGEVSQSIVLSTVVLGQYEN